ncbi:MAG: peptidoglycan DD-metalloendopeptidase family protein [Bacillota bacterium]
MQRLKPWLTWVLVVALSFSAAASFVRPALATGTSRAIDENQRRLEQIRHQIDQAYDSIARKRQIESQTLRTLNQLERQLAQTKRELAQYEQQLRQTEAEIVVAQTELAAAEHNLALRSSYLDTRLRTLYKHGSVSYLEVLFQSSSFSDFLQRARLLKLIIASDVRLLEEVKEQRREVATKKDQLEAKRATVAGLAEQTRVKQASVQAQTQQTQNYARQIQTDIAREQEALEEMEMMAEALIAVIRELQEQQRKELGLAQNKSDLVFQYPTDSRWVTSGFGMRFHPIVKRWKLHTGIDYGISSGKPIYAVEKGVVLYADWIAGYGLTVILDHGADVSTLYAHCSDILVKEGEVVAKGQIIAKVGNTGYSTGPHLHFEVRDGGTPVNPQHWLP